MKKLTLYQYFKLRAKESSDVGTVQDLIDDMKRDKELKGKSGAEIVNRICFLGDVWAQDALREFVQAYKTFCEISGYEYEKGCLTELEKWFGGEEELNEQER